MWYLNTVGQTYIEKQTKATSQPKLALFRIEEIPVPLPPLDEQRRIAAILDKADSIRRKRQEAIQLTEELLRSTFLDMFGDPVANPKQFKKIAMQFVCNKITDGTHHSPPIVPSGIPYITAKHLKLGGLDFDSDPWYVSYDDHRAIYARCDPQKGDVLYIKDGVTTGVAAINEYDFEFSMLSSLALLRCKGEICIPEYLCDYLNFPSVKTYALQNMAGAAIRRLTLAKIKNLEVVLPPLEMQYRYASRRTSLLKSVRGLTSGIELDGGLFTSLVQRAFRGEL